MYMFSRTCVSFFPRVSVYVVSFALARANSRLLENGVSTCIAKASSWDNYTIKIYRYYYVITINPIIVILIIDSVIIFIFTGIIIYIIKKKRSYSPYCFLPNAQVSETKRRANPKASTLVPDPAESG